VFAVPASGQVQGEVAAAVPGAAGGDGTPRSPFDPAAEPDPVPGAELARPAGPVIRCRQEPCRR
jgi:hypothetical protein